MSFYEKLFISITISFLVLSNQLHSQETCLANGDFTNACGNTTGICPTWTDACGDGWVRSHGSPEMKSYLIHPGQYAFYAYMWSRVYSTLGLRSEGMFTSYSFLANHSYHVRFRISTSNANGSVRFYAASNLTQSAIPTGNCGGPVPTPSPTPQLITQYNGFTNGNVDVDLTFIPTSNYSQIWIYPVATGSVQYDLAVYRVQICPGCSGTIIYNTGTVPSGETRAGTINVGSSAGTGGSGTVTVSGTQTTTLLATNEIRMLPDFSATVSTGSFSASLLTCNFDNVNRTHVDSLDIPIETNDESDDSTEDLARSHTTGAKVIEQEPVVKPGEINVYPTVSNGVLNIVGDPAQLSQSMILVYDPMGRKVYQAMNNSTNRKFLLNLSHMRAGIYLVQIKNSKKIITKRIIITR